MSATERLESLRMRHSQLERDLHDESCRPSPCEEQMNRIKREKLRIKDEIANLSAVS